LERLSPIIALYFDDVHRYLVPDCIGETQAVREFNGPTNRRKIEPSNWLANDRPFPEANWHGSVGSHGVRQACGVNTELATGVPYVSLDRVTGLTVEPGNQQALAQAIDSLLDDPGLRRKYGEAGRQRVLQEFRVQTMAERTWKSYEQVLQQ